MYLAANGISLICILFYKLFLSTYVADYLSN